MGRWYRWFAWLDMKLEIIFISVSWIFTSHRVKKQQQFTQKTHLQQTSMETESSFNTNRRKIPQAFHTRVHSFQSALIGCCGLFLEECDWLWSCHMTALIVSSTGGSRTAERELWAAARWTASVRYFNGSRQNSGVSSPGLTRALNRYYGKSCTPSAVTYFLFYLSGWWYSRTGGVHRLCYEAAVENFTMRD